VTTARFFLAGIAVGSIGASTTSCGVREPAARIIVDAPANPGASMPPESFPDDGRYWGNVVPDKDSEVLKVELSRVFMGADCWERAEQLGLSEGEACLNDYMVEGDTTLLISIPDTARASIARIDGPGVSYAVDVASFEAISEADNVDDVPVGTSYTPFPVVVEVREGSVVAVDQYWVP